MVNSGEVEAEYESEPEESGLLRRRSEASDDDEEVEEEGNEIAVAVGLNRRISYADQSDGREGAPEYYDDYDDAEVSYIDELEKLGEQVGEEEHEEEVAVQVTAMKQRGKEKVNDGGEGAFAVPRTGAFYMHDDRFGGLRRRSRDQRRKKNIRESKDELKWMHDKFEKMKLEEAYNKELNAFEVHRTSNDYHQGCNKNNTKSGGYKAKESRLHSKSGKYGSSLRTVKGRGPVRYKPLSRSISVNPPVKSLQLEKTQGMSSKAGSARVFSANEKLPYKMSLGETVDVDSEGALSNKCEQPAKHFEMTGDTDSSRVFSTKSKSGDLGMASYIDPASASFHGLNADCDSLPFDQHLSTPSMGYLQAFYPASSFLHDNSGTQKKIELPASKNALFPASVLRNRIAHVPQVDEFLPGNIALDIPFAKEGVCPVAENYFTKLSFQYSVPGSTHMAFPEPRDQRIRSSLSLPFTHQATPFPNQLNRVSSLAQHPIVQQMPVDSTIQPPSQVLTQQSLSHLQSGSQKSFETSSLSFREPGILESFRGSIQLKEASLGTGSNIIIPPHYSGIQGDQNFNATPVLFPGGGYYRDLVQSKGFQLSGDISVMQIGGLHHGSLCDPDIDITSTGYAGESQFHFRNSDLTWLPVLPAAAGALGATYLPPHVAPDSCSDNLTTPPFVNIASYATRTSIPSNEVGSGPSNGLVLDYVKKTEEQMNNECGKLQFKPTRYSRMNMKE